MNAQSGYGQDAPPPADPATLLGQPSQMGPASPAPAALTPEQQSEGFINEIRDLTIRITSLAREYPVAAEDFEIAIQSLINALTKSVIAQSSTEPMSAPNLVG